jgi:hypothetical protein
VVSLCGVTLPTITLTMLLLLLLLLLLLAADNH